MVNTGVLIGACLLLAASSPEAAQFSVANLHDWQLLQRTDECTACFLVHGVAPGPGLVTIECRRAGEERLLRGFSRALVTRTTRSGQWSGQIKDLPVGGPYQVTIRFAPTTFPRSVTTIERHGILVGDLWLATGGSNMVGPQTTVQSVTTPGEWALGRVRNPDAARNEPLEIEWLDPQRVTYGALALRFARRLRSTLRVPIGVLNFAVPDCSIDRWDPETGDLYRLIKNYVLEQRIRFCGMLWYQGEADALAGVLAEQYQQRLARLIEALRRDLGRPLMPFLLVQLGSTQQPVDPEAWNRIREAQAGVEAQVPYTSMVVSFDQAFSPDGLADTPAAEAIADRLASAALALHYGRDRPFKTPRLFRAALSQDGAAIALSFLHASEGLVVHDAAGMFHVKHLQDRKPVAEVRLAEDGQTLILHLGEPAARGALVSYGVDPARPAALFRRDGSPVPAFHDRPVE